MTALSDLERILSTLDADSSAETLREALTGLRDKMVAEIAMPYEPGPLPEPHWPIVNWTTREAGYTADQMRTYAAAEVERAVTAERAAKGDTTGIIAMADTMAYVRDELVRAGIVSQDVPPMFLPEAVAEAMNRAARTAAIAPIERDEDMDRTYIPLPGGWEVQTKGKGSTFRLLDPSGERLAVLPSPYLHEWLERMARDIHAALAQEPGR